MGRQITKKILDCKLIKMEKLFNQAEKQKFFYNLQLEGIDDLLLIETYHPIQPGLVGHRIKYKLNEENEVSEFEFET
jgi:hypothetical protein